MTRTERKKIIKKRNTLNKLTYGFISWFILSLVIILSTGYTTVNPYEIMAIIFLNLMLPLFSAMITSVIFARRQEWKLVFERRRLRIEKHKFHLKLFWEAIEAKNIDSAIKYYNTKNFLSMTDQIMCEGIIIGLNYAIGDKTKAVEKMNNFIL